MVARFLDVDAHNITSFDGELGYKLRNHTIKDGVGGAYSTNRYSSSGERVMLNFADQPCRINTYGNSFTQCTQVSDGETWQEYLAAHLGEPVRNFGVGGYGVYQAYRRMLREESTRFSAEYLVLNIWSDDHFRSIYKYRWFQIVEQSGTLARDTLSDPEAWRFSGTPWAHLRLNEKTGGFEECRNPYPTPESLYRLCDSDHVYEAFKWDIGVQASAARRHASDVNTEVLQKIADGLEIPADFSSPQATAQTAETLLQTCALRSSMYVVDRARAFAQEKGKKLIIFLSYSSADVTKACERQPRFDQVFVDYLEEGDFVYVDTLKKHVEDFELFKCSPQDYAQRYYIGHYNPKGNHFFAFAVKDAVVEWLDPRPPSYSESALSA